jgi:hypothetical protein
VDIPDDALLAMAQKHSLLGFSLLMRRNERPADTPDGTAQLTKANFIWGRLAVLER